VPSPAPRGGPVAIASRVYEWELPAPAGATGLTADGAIRCAGPNGETLTAAAFADGDRWRARVALTAPGDWRWEASDGAAGTIGAPPASGERWPAGPLRLSDDRRSLVDAAGAPFFYLADTAWAIVWKGTPEQWATYLDRRAAQGYSVLQVNLLPWRWELTDVAGNRPFHDGDPTRPNAAYFARYDQFIAMAAERGLFTCLMLIWGGPRPLLPAVYFSTEQAVAFARYAVARYAAYPMLWSLSGDAPYVQEIERWEAVGAAVESADPYGHPTTNHLPPSMNWHALHHASPWHDFHMLQTGHRRASIADIAALPAAYHRRRPAKPVVNGEPWYEAHPSRDTQAFGPNFTPAEARYAFWVSLLSGATMGHTYGSQGIWNWKRPGDDETSMAGPQIGPSWFTALEHAGAEHCAIGARFMRRLPWSRLQPAPERVWQEPPAFAPTQRPCCATDEATTWLVYLPRGAGQVTLKGIQQRAWSARWFDPRSGAEQPAGAVDVRDDLTWQAPRAPSADDWVLVVTT
jgi:hypothetical protein